MIKRRVVSNKNDKVINNNNGLNNNKDYSYNNNLNNENQKECNKGNLIEKNNENNNIIISNLDDKGKVKKNIINKEKNNLFTNDYSNKASRKEEDNIIISERTEKDQEILDIGVELPKESLSDSIKIIKKGKSDGSLSNISYGFIFKVALIGDSSTGKTSILLRFIDDSFKEDTKSTIGVDFKIVSFELEKKIYAKMQIWDTCGSERFKSLTSSFIKTCSAFILVFDLTRPNTFKSIDNWIKIIKENTTPKFLILIGNKKDLTELRAIEKNLILQYCRKHMFNYLEISARNNINIEKMFKEVAFQLYMNHKKSEKKLNLNVNSYGNGGNFSNIQVQLDNNIEKKVNKQCC